MSINLIENFSEFIQKNSLGQSVKKELERDSVISSKKETWRYFPFKKWQDQQTTNLSKSSDVADISKEFKDQLVFNGKTWSGHIELATEVSETDLGLYLELSEMTLLGLNTSDKVWQIDLDKFNGENLYLSFDFNQASYKSTCVFIKSSDTKNKNIFLNSNSPGVHTENLNFFIDVQEKASLNIYKLSQDSKNTNFSHFYINQKKDSQFNFLSLDISCFLNRTLVHLNILGENSLSKLKSLYLVKEDHTVENRFLVHHKVGKSHCEQLVKGILDDKSKAIFDGKIFVHKGADLTTSLQLNKNIILSSSAEIDTKPQLEIYADDVKCNHGATIGRLSEEELFYFASRAIEPNKAKALLTQSFVNDVLTEVSSEKIRSILQAATHRDLQNYKV